LECWSLRLDGWVVEGVVLVVMFGVWNIETDVADMFTMHFPGLL
jgi:hypothetical protein